MEDKEKNLHWLQVVYEEAWRQYNHEDNIAEQRDSKYLTILSLIFTAAGIVLSMLLSFLVEAESIGRKELVYTIGTLIIICLLLLLIIRFSVHWRRVTNAGKNYTRIRLNAARDIEQLEAFPVLLASDEEDRLKKLQAQDVDFDGFESTLRIIRTVTIFANALLIIGGLAIAVCTVLCFL